MTDNTKPAAPAVVNLADTGFLDVDVLRTVFPGTNQPTGWDITFAGPAHPKSIVLNERKERERLKKEADIERARVNFRKWKGDEDKNPDAERREFIEDMVSRIVSWTPVDFGNGPMTFEEGDSTAARRAVDLLMDRKFGAYVSQMVEFLTAEKAFIRASAKI